MDFPKPGQGDFRSILDGGRGFLTIFYSSDQGFYQVSLLLSCPVAGPFNFYQRMLLWYDQLLQAAGFLIPATEANQFIPSGP